MIVSQSNILVCASYYLDKSLNEVGEKNKTLNPATAWEH
jgi:hypothetical protein